MQVDFNVEADASDFMEETKDIYGSMNTNFNFN